jgi:hypothetical protein
VIDTAEHQSHEIQTKNDIIVDYWNYNNLRFNYSLRIQSFALGLRHQQDCTRTK